MNQHVVLAAQSRRKEECVGFLWRSEVNSHYLFLDFWFYAVGFYKSSYSKYMYNRIHLTVCTGEITKLMVFFWHNKWTFDIATASLIKRWVVPSVSAAQDERRAKRHCQEVYGPGEWGHCLHVAREMYLGKEKIAVYTGNDFFDIHPGFLHSWQSHLDFFLTTCNVFFPSWCVPIFSDLLRQGERCALMRF